MNIVALFNDTAMHPSRSWPTRTLHNFCSDNFATCSMRHEIFALRRRVRTQKHAL